MSEFPNEIAGRFILGAEIARRPSCAVFRGIDRSLGDRQVAIKFLIDRPGDRADWVALFNEEVAQLRAASHRTLVPIIASGMEDGWFYLAMELIEGPTLRDLLKGRSEPLEIDFSIDVISQICSGLTDLHAQGIYHGHIDPRAIMFKSGTQVRLAGYYPHIIAQIQKTITSGARLTTDPQYVAPEQVMQVGQVDNRADIFALAAILYEMTTAKKPFSAENPLQLAMARLTTVPESPAKLNPKISPILDAAILKGLAKERDERFFSVHDLLDAVTGGRRPVMNPLAEVCFTDSPAERMETATIGVSMSTASIREILNAHEAKQREQIGSGNNTVAAAAINAKASPAEYGALETKRMPSFSESFDNPVTNPVTPAPSNSGAGANIGAAAMDVAATAMGFSVGDFLKGTLICVSSEDRGRRYNLDKPQTMIGSDNHCDICIAHKSVPARYVIVVQRGPDYFVGPLSPSGMIINGTKTDGDGEVGLKRGDILTIGPTQLRFVAPGEVFTLKDEIADRTIDRPASKLPRLLALVSALAVVLCIILVYAYRLNQASRSAARQVTAQKKEAERKELIERFRREGDAFFKDGKYVEPINDNAKKRFEQIRELDPDDPYARRRLAEIDERLRAISEQEKRKALFAEQIAKLKADGDLYFKNGNYVSPPGSNARESFQEILRIDPANAEAKAKLEEITKILGDVVGRVNEMLVLAQGRIDAGLFVAPPGGNAFDVVQQILAVDPTNKEAKEMLYEMAARSVIKGDAAKGANRAGEAEEAYLTARAVGMNPNYIANKMTGLDTIRRSGQSTVVAVYRGNSEKKIEKSDPNFLDSDRVEQKIATTKRQQGVLVSGPSNFISVGKKP